MSSENSTLERSRPDDTDVLGSTTWQPGEAMLRDAWFPVAHSPSLKGQAMLRMVHSQPFHIWRDADRLRATDWHPGAKRVDQPNAMARNGDYPVIERFGHIWVWYGDPANADPALMPDIPFLPYERAQPSYARGVNFFHSTYELVLENILDLTHVDFVHGSFRGGADHAAEQDEVRFQSTSETVTMTRLTRGRPTSSYQRDVLGVSEKFQDQTLFAHVFIRSGMCFLHSRYSSAPSIPLMQSNTPESRTLTRANYAFGIEQTTDEGYRRMWPRTAATIADQDEAVLNPQNPRYLDRPPRNDCSTRFDAAGLHFRRRYNALVERQKRGDFSYLPDSIDDGQLGETLGVRRPK
jgi:phenylpropionate dioxygenase-like ring-hydroxylating dioxygenase large terminal subunit